MTEAIRAEVGTALDTEVEVFGLALAEEWEFLSTFALVMHEWNFKPFQQGRVRFPTFEEARDCLAKSPYNGG